MTGGSGNGRTGGGNGAVGADGVLPGMDAAVRVASGPADYRIERRLGAHRRIAGVDEVGRGAWAGPVVVGVAITDLTDPPSVRGRGGRPVALTDSKLLTPEQRAEFADLLPGWLVAHAVGESAATEIDEVGMTEALRRATVRALERLPFRPDTVILDGGHDYLGGSWQVCCEIKADQRSVSVAAASVLAKVHRDRLLAELDAECPGYGFAESAGYPSPVHQDALREHGPTPHHRLSWSYLDDLPRWRHLKRARDPHAGSGQLSLI